jgi:methionine sulfoxide reductase catalytic subunit
MDDIYKSVPVLPSEITPQSLYMNRRAFLKAAGIFTGGALLAACAPGAGNSQSSGDPSTVALYAGKTDELGNPLNSYDDITNYNNYYEFSTAKDAVAPLSKNFKPEPWSVEVSGLVSNPKTYTVDDLIKRFPPQDRIYRLRCVEAWSMVIPWQGFPLGSLLKEVQPTSEAKYVRFETLMDQSQLPAEADPNMYPWPYQEGLRLDEAMNDLAILATGLYGSPLPAQDGAPIRLIVPWKYGFKGIKAIVKIELVAEQPGTFWSEVAPNEYGFYANVNPNVPHPRWLQSSERRIGELNMRPTLMFNGYADKVAYLYQGMDLKQNY